MRIVCVRHVRFEGPGAIGDWAALRGHSFANLQAPKQEWPDPSSFDMLAIMGGSMGVCDGDAHPWIAGELDFIGSAIASGKTVLGVCLGSQMLAHVLGGRVRTAEAREIGWYPVRLTEAGRASRLFSVWPDEFVAGHWHGDTFDLPDGVNTAASSEFTRNQAFEFDDGRVVGLQCHLEWAPEGLRKLVRRHAAELEEGGPWIMDADTLFAEPRLFRRNRRMLYDLLDRMEALR
ncbi:MAG: type 1 glutamine amidotransferase [Coriobacteriia bacterium]|nr:type 1 glutamine amidotransferase [Coriobacteriia bacterium]